MRLDHQGSEIVILRDLLNSIEEHRLADTAQSDEYETLGMPALCHTRQRKLRAINDLPSTGQFRRLIARTGRKRVSYGIHINRS